MRINHGHDYASNRTWREDTVAAAQSPAVHIDELYDYDGFQQLTDLDRGNLDDETKDEIVAGTSGFAEEWGLEPLGNWAEFKRDSDGDGNCNLDQDRTHNKANETTDITETAGRAWVTPVHDAAGNMTTVPYPASPTGGLTLKYDAWNRLASAQYGELWEITFEYDGLNRRIVQGYDFGAQRQYYDYSYHNASWELLERRFDQGQGGQPETQGRVGSWTQGGLVRILGPWAAVDSRRRFRARTVPRPSRSANGLR